MVKSQFVHLQCVILIYILKTNVKLWGTGIWKLKLDASQYYRFIVTPVGVIMIL